MLETPDYTEDAVSLAIAIQLALAYFPRFGFSIQPISRRKERWLGADARLLTRSRGFLPFYMQFKRPFAHAEPSKADIVKNRKALIPALSTTPRTLFFGLQPKRKNHNDFQHNILYRLRQRLLRFGLGDAAYVCPLFLNRETYAYHSHMAGLWRWMRYWPVRPYSMSAVEVIDKTSVKFNFNNVPILSEHVSIPPHALVSDANHYYSFSESGDELCFHSPLSIPDGSLAFSKWLSQLVEQAVSPERKRSIVTPETAKKLLYVLTSQNEDDEFKHDFGLKDDNNSGIEAWFAWGNYLSVTYGIEQFGIVLNEPQPSAAVGRTRTSRARRCALSRWSQKRREKANG